MEAVSPNATEYDQYDPSKGAIDRQLGLLVNAVGDFKAAKDASRPLFRVIGGDGLLVLISEPTPRRVVVQQLIVAAGLLAEKKFKSQARDVLARDQNASATDPSKWPEMAFATRRLALDTTEKNANKVVDEFFASALSQKYRSHVWAYLPTSVIKHLASGTYLSVDTFGPNTEFPYVREQIVAELKRAPAEPYSEFLLYTLGRFDDAVRFSKNSPIHTSLTYASAHSKLRQVMAALFLRAATPADPTMLSFETKSYVEELNPENVQFQSVETITAFQEAKKKIDEDRAKLSDADDKLNGEQSAPPANRDFFHGHAYETIVTSENFYRDSQPSLTQYFDYFNEFPERYDSRPLVQKYPDFAALTALVLSQFEEVMEDRKSPHFDDAAYFAGWLNYHRGNLTEALGRFELAIALMPKVGAQAADDGASIEYVDYGWASVRQVARILRTLPPEDALARVRASKVLSAQPHLWYAALDTLYISHHHQMVMKNAQLALAQFGITLADLPLSTDPKRISDVLTKFNLAGETDLAGIIYLYNASREAEALRALLSDPNKKSSKLAAFSVRALVVKYSLTKDSDLQPQSAHLGVRPRHKDLRQGIYLSALALDLLPKTQALSGLREWLHYKRITLLAQFDPVKVPAANAEFQAEFPNSALLNDGMAEQVFGEAVVIGDMVKATGTFAELVRQFPTGNAVDNAMSWIAIGWTCYGRADTARAVNEDIVRLFPSTRHATYARERLKDPHRCADMQDLFNWDYNAMNWRQRTRLDIIQAAFASPPR